MSYSMSYLHSYDRHLFKINIAMFYFYHSKNLSNVMKNIFNSIFIYEKNLFVNKYEKQICYKEKKYLFFDVMKNG